MTNQIEIMAQAKFFAVCTPEMAYKWLEQNALKRTGERSDPIFLDIWDERLRFETILLERNDPLIDFGLARFGCSDEVAEKLYERLDADGRRVMRACHAAQGGPAGAFGESDDWSGEVFQELVAWMYNPFHSTEFFEALFARTGSIGKLDDEQYKELVIHVSNNERLAMAYEPLSLDGYDDYLYHKVFGEAWKLAIRVPATQEWAAVLWDLFGKLVKDSAHDFDVNTALERWRIEEGEVDFERWYKNPPSFFVRCELAGFLKADDDLLNASDPALRMSFYKRFHPSKYKGWPDFLERDKEVFFQGVLDNLNVWRDPNERARLSDIAWQVPDPGSTMDAINDYRHREAHMESKHPEWFAVDE